jgi:methionine-rich copper-binding protein CopC
MLRILRLMVVVAFACGLATTSTFAHAFLDRAVPGVGTTVRASPSELELRFTESIVPAFSGAHIATQDGKPIATSKPVLDPAQRNILHVRLRHALRPGTYVVTWHVVSVDTHRTSGSYKFTVGP